MIKLSWDEALCYQKTVEDYRRLHRPSYRTIANEEYNVSIDQGKRISHVVKTYFESIEKGDRQKATELKKAYIEKSLANAYALSKPGFREKDRERIRRYNAKHKGRNKKKNPKKKDEIKKPGIEAKPISQAHHYAMIAISQLERIKYNDINSRDAFMQVKKWVDERLRINGG